MDRGVFLILANKLSSHQAIEPEGDEGRMGCGEWRRGKSGLFFNGNCLHLTYALSAI